MEFSKVKMSYVHKLPIRPLEHRTITTIFDIQANNNPDRDAFVFYTSGQQSSYTFRQIQEMSLSLAASLLHIGWKRGHKVVLMIPNQIEFVVSYIALLRIGINVILVPAHGWPADEVIAQMKRLGCNGLIIHADSISSFDIQGIRRDLGPMVLIEAGGSQIDISKGDCSSYEKLLKEGKTLDETEVLKNQEEIQMDDPATALFTSGSTGPPKAVQHTHHALVNSFLLSAVNDPTKSGTMGMRIFNDRPFSWAGGLGTILAVMARGSTDVVAPAIKTVKERDVDFVLNILQNEKCSCAILMYYIISDMLSYPRLGDYDLSSLKVLISGGQDIPMDFLKRLKAIFPHCHLRTLYGLTEVLAAPIGTRSFLPNAPIEDQSIHVGMEITPSFEVKIIDKTSNLVPVGTVGEIAVRSPLAFLEYLDAAEETSKVISRTRWVHTGDLGRIDESGRLTICGRKSEIIKRATVKIYPAEIEQRLIKHPDVGKVIVVGVPESRLFEELCACVIPTQGCFLDSNVFEEWDYLNPLVDEQGLSVKPKYTLVLEEFPLTKTGKIDRKAVRNIAIKKLDIRTDEA